MSAAPDQVLGVTGVCGSSVGGGEVRVWRIDGFAVELDGLYPTLLLVYPDHPGVVAQVSGTLAAEALNIAEMRIHRTARGGEALMVLSLGQEPPAPRSIPSSVSRCFSA